jgi:protein gp37
MAITTEISWTESTVNWWWGCCKISEGCKNCYAEADNDRFGIAEWGPGTIRTWTKTSKSNATRANNIGKSTGRKRRVFTLSMGDFFEDHSGLLQYRAKAWAYMKSMKHIDWLVLTKRPDNILSMLPPDFFSGEYNHIHLGSSCEHEKYVGRLDDLRNIPEWGGIRFVSYEPALSAIDHVADLTNIDWLIYGGESSRSYLGFRKDNDDWARGIKRLCEQTGTVFFYKQNSGLKRKLIKKLDGVQYYNFPDFNKNHGKAKP